MFAHHVGLASGDGHTSVVIGVAIRLGLTKLSVDLIEGERGQVGRRSELGYLVHRGSCLEPRSHRSLTGYPAARLLMYR